MSGSYCRYYSLHAIVVTTVVSENHMPTHAIFFLCQMHDVGQQFLKKIVCILPIGYFDLYSSGAK